MQNIIRCIITTVKINNKSYLSSFKREKKKKKMFFFFLLFHQNVITSSTMSSIPLIFQTPSL